MTESWKPGLHPEPVVRTPLQEAGSHHRIRTDRDGYTVFTHVSTDKLNSHGQSVKPIHVKVVGRPVPIEYKRSRAA